MNARQRKKHAKQHGLNFGDNRHARRRRAAMEAHKRPSGESPVRPSRARKSARKAPAPAPEHHHVEAETREPIAPVSSAKAVTHASAELAKAAGGLAAEAVKYGVEAGVEAVKGAARKGAASTAHVAEDLLDKVPIVGPAASRKLREVTEDDEPDSSPKP